MYCHFGSSQHLVRRNPLMKQSLLRIIPLCEDAHVTPFSSHFVVVYPSWPKTVPAFPLEVSPRSPRRDLPKSRWACSTRPRSAFARPSLCIPIQAEPRR